MALHFSALPGHCTSTRGAAAPVHTVPAVPSIAKSSSRSLRRCPSQATESHNRSGVVARVIIKSRIERADADIEKVLFTTEQLNEILDDLGRRIGQDYANKSLLVLGVLKGGFMFTADLIRHIQPVPPAMDVEFFKAESYGMGNQSSTHVKLDKAFDLSLVKDRHVLVCEDIIDTGLTMSSVVKLLRASGATSVRICCLLDKRTRRKHICDADYVGMVCPDEFVVGYGIDFAERYRWLPYIGVPKPEIVEQIQSENKRKAAEKAAEEEARAAQDETLQRIEAANGVLQASNGHSKASNGHANGGNGHANSSAGLNKGVVVGNVVGANGIKPTSTSSSSSSGGLLLAAKPVRR